MSGREPTRGTEIAALEARHNEDRVRAEGSLLGERRASIARLVMILMFASITMARGGPRNSAQMIVGTAYTLYSAVMIYGAWFRLKGGNVQRARWAPLAITTVDFALITTMSLLDTAAAGAFEPAKHAISAAIIISFAIGRARAWHLIYAVALAELSWTIASTAASGVELHMRVFVMGGFVVLGFMLYLTNRAVGTMFLGLRQRDNLTRFLPRQVADRVIAEGPNALAPVEREVTVLFSDIRGFTGMSEGLEPRELLAMLDDYFARMSQIVKGHDGVVGKFLGDGMLAFWGVPDRDDAHAARAVAAARDMRTVLVELNRERAQDGKPPIRIGIGIHTGTVAAGMLGGALQSEYTIIGDAVNVASRVEGLTKDHAVDVLISETTRAQLGDAPRATRLAEAQIRGRKEPVVLYTLDA